MTPKVPPFSKPVRLTEKELRRADRTTEWAFTVITRRIRGGFVAAAIDISTGLPLFNAVEVAETREGISGAARQVCRHLAKLGLSTSLTSGSRHRPGRKLSAARDQMVGKSA